MAKLKVKYGNRGKRSVAGARQKGKSKFGPSVDEPWQNMLMNLAGVRATLGILASHTWPMFLP
jgi:hypothetical protein